MESFLFEYFFYSNLRFKFLKYSILYISCCIRYVKDTILKAIYNKQITGLAEAFAVFDMSKIQFWKQFTTSREPCGTCNMLYSICQRYNFESNLQLEKVSVLSIPSCIRYVKDTILKAIYNGSKKKTRSFSAVFDMSKIQFWKQFTTVVELIAAALELYSICQRYNFESNLQRRKVIKTWRDSCIRYVKDTILKAIYNFKADWKTEIKAVFDMSKIQFWKQFTTDTCPHRSSVLLYSICQRYNFESNLQQ